MSTDPQLIVVAVYTAWQTYENLRRTGGFTVSVPTADQFEGVWRLGARYSRHTYPDRSTKLRGSGLEIVDIPGGFGPVLAGGLGWLSCRTVQKLHIDGDHGVFLGQVEHVEFDPASFDADGSPTIDIQPLMRVTGNRFSTSETIRTVPYGTER